jgi:hypothetical protein
MFSTTLLSSCGVDWSEDNLRPVEDSLGYEKLLGTYVFRPTAEQAERLMIDSNEVVTMRITKDSLVNFNSIIYKGKYHIDKMVLMIDSSYPKRAYVSTWEYSFLNRSRSNNLTLAQPYLTKNNLDYKIERSPDNDTLHICGYGDDQKNEVMRLVDFKKIE